MNSLLSKKCFITQFKAKAKSNLMNLKLPVKSLLVIDIAPTLSDADQLVCDKVTATRHTADSPEVDVIAIRLKTGKVSATPSIGKV